MGLKARGVTKTPSNQEPSLKNPSFASSHCSSFPSLLSSPTPGECNLRDISVFALFLSCNLREIFRFGHSNPGKRGTLKISPKFHDKLHGAFWQRKTEKKFTPHFLQGGCSDFFSCADRVLRSRSLRRLRFAARLERCLGWSFFKEGAGSAL